MAFNNKLELNISDLIGRYFATDDTLYCEGDHSSNIIYVKGNSSLKGRIDTEVMWVVDGQIKSLYTTDWSPELFHREATPIEIGLFKNAKQYINSPLPNFIQAVIGGLGLMDVSGSAFK